MSNFIKTKVFTDNGILRLFCFILIVLVSSSCNEDCTDSYALYEAYYQAVIYPETFDNYVQNNLADFNDDFFTGLNEKSRTISDKVREERQFCDDAHEQGSEFWNDCYDDIDQTYGGIYNALEAIKEVSQNGKLYEQTEFGIYMTIGKNMMEQGEWEYLMKQLIPETKEYLKYTTCE